MTTLDVLIIIVFVAAVAVGFWRGIIVQVGAVGALIAGVVLARIGGDAVARLIAGHAAEVDTVDVVLAKALLFIAGYVGVRLIALLLKKTTHALSLGALDRLGGVVFCLVEWMLIFSLLLNLWLVIKPDATCSDLSTLANGKVAEAIVDFAPTVLGWALC